MYPLKQATEIDLMVYIPDDDDGSPVTGLSDGDFTKRISKNAGSFAAWSTSLAEAEGGFYTCTLSATDTATLGILTCYLSADGAAQQNLQFRVHARIPDNLAYPTTTGRSMDVASGGEVAIDLSNTYGSLEKDTDITGFNDPAVSSIADAVWDEAKSGHTTSTSFGDLATDLDSANTAIAAVDTAVGNLNDFDYSSEEVTVGTNNDKTGYALSAAGVDSILDEVVSTYTMREILTIALAVLAGKSTGGGTTTNNYRDVGDTKNIVQATVDADGNRSAISLNP